jgi:hypothetical protein
MSAFFMATLYIDKYCYNKCGASDTLINVGNRASHWCVIE